MPDEKSPCSHAGDARLVFPCSGAADVGEIADRAARMITRDGVGRMCCLGGIAGRVPEILQAARAAEKILAIDGCPSDCARKTLELAGFAGFHHLRVTDLGMVKGETPPKIERVRSVVQRGAGLLRSGAHEPVA